MDNAVDSIVKKCCPCQIATAKPSRETLKMIQLPCGPWHQVSVDVCEVAGLYVLVGIHDYFRFPDIEIVHSTAAKAVSPKLDRIFAAYGVPEFVKTYNGPSFNGHEFAQFADYRGFVFRKSPPYGQRQMAKLKVSWGLLERYFTPLQTGSNKCISFSTTIVSPLIAILVLPKLLLLLDDQSESSYPGL